MFTLRVLVLSFTCILSIHANLDFRIVPSIASVGYEVSLVCQSSVDADLDIVRCNTSGLCENKKKFGWYQETDKNSETSSKQVQASDDAYYKCVNKANNDESELLELPLIQFEVKDGLLTPSETIGSSGFPTVAENNVNVSCRATWVKSDRTSPLSTVVKQANGAGDFDLGHEFAFTDSKFEEIAGNPGTFILNEPEYHNAGDYYCVAKGPQGTYDGAYSTVKVNAAIFVNAEQKPKNLMEGDDATFNCKFQAYPFGTISWFQKTEGEEERPVVPNERVTFSNLKFDKMEFSNGTLTIKDLQFEDRAIYRCEVVNDYGNNSISFELRVRDKYAALWPFLGIVAEVVILCIIIFVCEKQRAKKAAKAKIEHEKNGTANDKSASNAGSEVRQRK